MAPNFLVKGYEFGGKMAPNFLVNQLRIHWNGKGKLTCLFPGKEVTKL